MNDRIIKYTEALKEATDQIMQEDQKVFVIGLGVSYKNGADGTTAGLKDKYPDRVFDVPVSENGFTGMAVGAAISGLRPIVHHGRVEFALLASDPIFTQSSKWNYMFGGGNPVPIVFRINIGRQWGNGPQHTQALYSLFGNVPGLKVVVPSTPRMAKGLLSSAIKENSPVVLLEPRWLFNIKQHVSQELFYEPIDKARIVEEGNQLTLVSYGDGVFSCMEALELIKDKISVELIDLVCINPIDFNTITTSVKKTKKLVCVDTTNKSFNIGGEIISKIAQNNGVKLDLHPSSLSCPDVPCPTSTVLTENYYPTRLDIANRILEIFNYPSIKVDLSFEELHLAPNKIIK
ncbi:MAG: transketolase C-terminal domain-containing protein [Patescibacteria group bacterium]